MWGLRNVWRRSRDEESVEWELGKYQTLQPEKKLLNWNGVWANDFHDLKEPKLFIRSSFKQARKNNAAKHQTKLSLMRGL